MKAHLQAYAVVAEDVVVDLDELVDRTALGQCCIRTARQALSCPSLAARCFGATPCCCRRRRRRTAAEAAGPPEPVEESETEDEGTACAARQVGWRRGDGESLTLLASSVQCGDKALSELTQLLTDDAKVSPYTRGGEGTKAPLCAHHAALYQGMRRGLACAKAHCNVAHSLF